MAMTCTVCLHPQRNAIESLASLGTESERRIAKQFGLTAAAVHRHKVAHISKRLTKAVARAEVKAADEFLDSVRAAMLSGATGAQQGLARAGEIDAATAYRSAPAFLAQQLRAAELLGQATGRLTPQTAGGVNIALQIVMPRVVDESQPAIEVTATVVAESTTSEG